jgi:hypothetical protein
MRQDILSRVERISKDSIAAAGPRYAPALDPDAPNIRITSLLTALEALSAGFEYRDRVSALMARLSDSWSQSAGTVRTIFADPKNGTPTDLCDLLDRLRSISPGQGRQRCGR